MFCAAAAGRTGPERFTYLPKSNRYRCPAGELRWLERPNRLRFLKPSVPVLGKRGMMRNLLIEAQTGEPAPRHMHAQLLYQLALASDAVQIAHQQNAQQEFRINRRPPGLAVAVFQLHAYKLEADVLVDEP